jgi:hypothetical protein
MRILADLWDRIIDWIELTFFSENEDFLYHQSQDPVYDKYKKKE